MKTKLMALLLVAGGSLLAETNFSIGIHVGTPRYYGAVPAGPAPVTVAAYRTPCPGPGYVWIDGYRDGYGNWFDGRWALPPYAGSYWVAPRSSGGHFYAGYWGGARNGDRDDFRFRESRESEGRNRELREGGSRERGGNSDRGRDLRR